MLVAHPARDSPAVSTPQVLRAQPGVVICYHTLYLRKHAKEKAVQGSHVRWEWMAALRAPRAAALLADAN